MSKDPQALDQGQAPISAMFAFQFSMHDGHVIAEHHVYHVPDGYVINGKVASGRMTFVLSEEMDTMLFLAGHRTEYNVKEIFEIAYDFYRLGRDVGRSGLQNDLKRLLDIPTS
jgi:hypothetical protein